jgi:hypothetical protein
LRNHGEEKSLATPVCQSPFEGHWLAGCSGMW